jgi:integrase
LESTEEDHPVVADILGERFVDVLSRRKPKLVPFETWDEADAVAAERGPFGPVGILGVGTGMRPEEAFGADWSDLDPAASIVHDSARVRGGELKTYAKTARSRRRVPMRRKVIASLETLPQREGILFPAAGGGRIDINNWRSREWPPALKARASSTGGFTTCGTRSRRGASSRWRAGWAPACR